MPQLAAVAWPAAKFHGADVLTADVVRLGDGWAARFPAMVDCLSVTPTLCHADWKPDNLFFDADGSVTVIDAQVSSVIDGAFDVGYFVSQSLAPAVRSGRGAELVRRYVDAMAQCGVVLDLAEVFFKTRVAVGLCLVYGFSLFAGFDQMGPGERASARSLLRRCAEGCHDFAVIDALERLA
jgi:aminoglycoside/choline kinase family phosphotransferase